MKIWRSLFALPVAALILLPMGAAQAETDNPNPCGVEGWFVNPDEADRTPERTVEGFVFENTDLVHQAAPAGLTTKDLKNGDFHATPLPDQESFFSVEVAGPDGKYGTLRWNTKTKMWNLVAGGQFYEHADPDVLVDLPPDKRSHTVITFGVGYTKSPPGTIKTTVTSVAFMGKAYKLSCLKPTTSPTPSTSVSPTVSTSPTATSTASTTPSASASSSTTSTPSTSISATSTPKPSSSVVTPSVSPATNGEELPVTGGSVGKLFIGALAIIAIGGALFLVARRRRS